MVNLTEARTSGWTEPGWAVSRSRGRKSIPARPPNAIGVSGGSGEQVQAVAEAGAAAFAGLSFNGNLDLSSEYL